MALFVYADDIVLASNNAHVSQKFKTYLNDCFSIKDIESLKYSLDIEIARGVKECFYGNIIHIGDHSQMSTSRGQTAEFPMEEYHKLALATEREFVDPT